MSTELEALEDLQDARADLAHYRRLLLHLAVGVIAGFLFLITSALMSVLFGWGAGEVIALWLPGGALLLACGGGFLGRVVSAHEDDGNCHPARRVRAVERTYSRMFTGGK